MLPTIYQLLIPTARYAECAEPRTPGHKRNFMPQPGLVHDEVARSREPARTLGARGRACRAHDISGDSWDSGIAASAAAFRMAPAGLFRAVRFAELVARWLLDVMGRTMALRPSPALEAALITKWDGALFVGVKLIAVTPPNSPYSDVETVDRPRVSDLDRPKRPFWLSALRRAVRTPT